MSEKQNQTEQAGTPAAATAKTKHVKIRALRDRVASKPGETETLWGVEFKHVVTEKAGKEIHTLEAVGVDHDLIASLLEAGHVEVL